MVQNLSHLRMLDAEIEMIVRKVGREVSLYNQGTSNVAVHAFLDESKENYQVTSINVGDSVAFAYIPSQERVVILAQAREFEERIIGGTNFQPSSITRLKPYSIDIHHFTLPAGAIIFTISDGVWSRFLLGNEIKEENFVDGTHRYKTPKINVAALGWILSSVTSDKVSDYIIAIRNHVVIQAEAERRELCKAMSILESLRNTVQQDESLYLKSVGDKKIAKSITECLKENSYSVDILQAIEFIKTKEYFTDQTPFLALLNHFPNLGDDNMVYGIKLPEYKVSLIRSFVENRYNKELIARIHEEITSPEERSLIITKLSEEKLDIFPGHQKTVLQRKYPAKLEIVVDYGDINLLEISRYSGEKIGAAAELIENFGQSYWQLFLKSGSSIFSPSKVSSSTEPDITSVDFEAKPSEIINMPQTLERTDKVREEKVATGTELTVLALHSIQYDNPVLNHPNFVNLLMEAKQSGGMKAVNRLIDGDKTLKSSQYNKFVLLKNGNIPAEPESFTSSNDIPGFSANQLVAPLFGVRQFIEYLPMIKYLAVNFFPKSVSNITLAEFLSYTSVLITVHLTTGYAAIMLLPPEDRVNTLAISTIGSIDYATKLLTSDYLKSIDNSMEPLQQCEITILAYTIPGLVSCSIIKLMLPEFSCSKDDLIVSAGLSGMQCYSIYKEKISDKAQTTTDLIMPYIMDGIMLVLAVRSMSFDNSNTMHLMLSIKQCFSVINTIVITDYMTKMTLGLLSQEFKTSYTDQGFNYIYESVNEMSGILQNFFNLDNEL